MPFFIQLCLLWLVCFNIQAEPHPTTKFRHLSNADGLSQLQVNAISQDKDGFIWIATADGLNRFDGYEFKVYRPDGEPGSLPDHVVLDVLVTRDNTLWVATAKGLVSYDRNNDRFINHQDSNRSAPLRVISLFEDSQSDIWVGSKNHGLSRFDKNTRQLQHFSAVTSQQVQGNLNQIDSIAEDENGVIWIGTNAGLYFVEPEQNRLAPYQYESGHSLSDPRILALAVKEGMLWIGTQGGLNRLDLASGAIASYYHQADGAGIADNQVQAIYSDSAGNIWFATYNGLSKLLADDNRFITFRQDNANQDSINGRIFTSIFEDATGVVWIGSFADGISLFNSKDQQFGHYNTQSLPQQCLSANAIYASLYDSQGYLWLGAYGGGLHKLKWPSLDCSRMTGNDARYPGLSSNLVTALFEDSQQNIWVGTVRTGIDRLSPNGQISNFRHDAENPQSITNGSVFAFVEDHQQNLWIGTAGGGLSRYSPQQNRFSRIRHNASEPDSLASDSINVMLVDSEGMIWIGTDDAGLDRLNPLTGQFRHFAKSKTRPDGTGSQIFSLHQDSQGILWFSGGNSGLGRYDLDKNQFSYFTTRHGLSSNTIYKVTEDGQQNLWLSTNNGLSRFNRQTQTFTNFTADDGLQNQEFTWSGLYHGQSDELFAMGVNGFNAFHAAKINLDKQAPIIAITDFRLFNEAVDIRSLNEDGVNNVTELKRLQLNYDDSMFSLQFAALHFADAKRNRYAYKMAGFDDNWRYTNAKQRVATYTNISPGTYTFTVKGSNKDGVWNDQGRSVEITILPPIWLTWWAKTIYLLLLTVTPVVFYRVRTRALRNRAQRLEQTVNDRTVELSREKSIVESLLAQKSDELANVSHEFRTPLTLIMSSAKAMSQQALPDNCEQKLQVINNNSLRLTRMVDQLLMLEKFKVQKIARTRPQSLKSIVTMIVQSFTPLADEKQLNLTIEQLDDIWLQSSSDVIETIVLNLLSNAIKFTPNGGYVGISVRQNLDRQCQITVRDTGCGIEPEIQKVIFDRFERGLDERNHDIAGAGIGLALVKELVNAHGGHIEVNSVPGKGACFEVVLDGIVDGSGDIQDRATPSKTLAQEHEHLALQLSGTDLDVYRENEPDDDGKPVILVVEDNQDMCKYIVETLQPTHHCIAAPHGEAGLMLAEKVVPDLIVSDVMMPKMDGFALVQNLRSNLATSHIPVILLTARGDRDSRLKGWTEQADDYLTKPFDEQELVLRVTNLLAIRSIIRQRFSQQVVAPQRNPLMASEPAQETVESNKDNPEQAFIDKLNEVVASHYQNEQLRIGMVAADLSMSERAFSRKLKGVLNMSPSDYIRTYRLQKSVELLKQGCQVKQIAFSVGFTSHAYFCHCFKAYYQVPPTEYLTRQ